MSFWQTLAHGASFQISLPPLGLGAGLVAAFFMLALLQRLPGGRG